MTTQFLSTQIHVVQVVVLSLVINLLSLDLHFGSTVLDSVTHGRETKFKQITSKLSCLHYQCVMLVNI